MSKSTYNAPIVTMPDTTVFSIDPKTNKPYATIDYAESLAYTHISRFAKNLTEAIDPEDIKQELMLKLCIAKYDPTKSAPNTFMILCFKSHCARIWERQFRVRDRNKETNDFALFDQDGEQIMATEYIGVEEATPEDYLNASQVYSDYLVQNDAKPRSKKTLQPDCWKGVRPKRWEGKIGPRKSKKKSK